jgi:hypothetical protein
MSISAPAPKPTAVHPDEPIEALITRRTSSRKAGALRGIVSLGGKRPGGRGFDES